MFGFIKRCFFTGLVFLSTLTGIISLSCISMNNQECKVRPQFFNVNGDDPIVQSCVSDVVKNLNVKVFNLVSKINETRRIAWHEKCKCKCRFEHSVCNNKQHWKDDKCRCECKECKELFGILVTVSVNVTNSVILASI